jgi:hypothetical protein
VRNSTNHFQEESTTDAADRDMEDVADDKAKILLDQKRRTSSDSNDVLSMIVEHDDCEAKDNDEILDRRLERSYLQSLKEV